MAGNYCIPEVTILFHNKLLRGNRTVKVDCESFAAFDSPNLAPLAVIGIDINGISLKYLKYIYNISNPHVPAYTMVFTVSDLEHY